MPTNGARIIVRTGIGILDTGTNELVRNSLDTATNRAPKSIAIYRLLNVCFWHLADIP